MSRLWQWLLEKFLMWVASADDKNDWDWDEVSLPYYD